MEAVPSAEAGQEDELSDVDRLIAEADLAAVQTEREAVADEIVKTKGRRKSAAESAERAETMRLAFAGLTADDAHVEDLAYEWVFSALEAEAGIARPEKIDTTIEALRKAGGALRRLAAIEPKSEALNRKMTELSALHDGLFAKVQAATVDALESLKDKYKGEESELERRYGSLIDGPLVRGIEQAPDTPEARVEALKQEIVEVMLKPVVDGRMKPLENKLSTAKESLSKLESAYSEAQEKWRKAERGSPSDYEARAFAERNLVAVGTLPREFRADDLRHLVSNTETRLKKTIAELEPVIRRDRLAFETNRAILDEVLGQESDEVQLHEAFIQLRTLISEYRSAVDRGGSPLNTGDLNDLARNILGHYLQYGATMSQGSHEDWSPTDQIIGSRLGDSYGNRDTKSALQYVSKIAFVDSRLPDHVGSIGYSYNLTPENLVRRHAELASKSNPFDKEKTFLKAYPTAADLVGAFYAGEGKFLNLRSAHQKIDADLAGEKPRVNENTSAGLAAYGWKMSKLGAIVEPGQDARAVDRSYGRTLERLSASTVNEAERAFDLRNPEGGFRVYTLEQAADLLRRSRRDAMKLVEEVAREKGALEREREEGAGKTQGLERRIAELDAQLGRVRKEAESRQGELEGRLELAAANAKAQEAEARRLMAEKRDVEDRIAEIMSKLRGALEKKPGLLGGNKALQSAVEEIVRG